MARSQSSLDVQTRDLSFLRGLFEARAMTAAHAAAMFFDEKREYTKKRLQKMKAAGLVCERSRRANERAVLHLTRKGFALLGERGELNGYPGLSKNAFDARARVSVLTIRHELAVMDVKAAIYQAVRKRDTLRIEEFTTWPLLNQFTVSSWAYGSEILVRPDGFLRLHEDEPNTRGFTHSFFLEVDRSSENQNVLVERAALYQEYKRSGGFSVRNGGTTADVGDFPFRVLIVFKNAERRNNTAERLIAHNPPILRHAWLTTFDEICAGPLGPIWVIPADYRLAVQGTRFEAQSVTGSFEFRRDREREAFVETKIRKLCFLDDC